MSATTEALRAELAAAADRETQAERAAREAYEELKRARTAYQAARRAYDTAAAAEEFARTHPALFGDDSAEPPAGTAPFTVPAEGRGCSGCREDIPAGTTAYEDASGWAWCARCAGFTE